MAQSPSEEKRAALKKAIRSPKQRAFCEEYLIDLNGQKAAERAGYAPSAARVQASNLLTNANIRAYIDFLQSERSERTQITADDVLTGIARVTEKAENDEEYGHALKGFELLGKHHKLFTDKVEIDALPTVVVRSYTKKSKPDAAGV